MTPSPPFGPAHQHHDRLLIAALVAEDAAGVDRERAIAQVQACDSCRDLVTELQAITRAVGSMPMTPRPIGADFQITVRDAHRLARGAWWRRVLRPFGSARGSLLRPAAATMMTLGLVGLILSAGTLLQIGATGAAPADLAFGPTRVVSESAPASSAGTGGIQDRLGTVGAPLTFPSGLPESTAPAVAAGPTMSAGPAVAAGPTTTVAPPVAADATKGSPEVARSPAPTVDRGLLAMVSGLLLIGGVGVFLLRRAAVRIP